MASDFMPADFIEFESAAATFYVATTHCVLPHGKSAKP
jgi:hypothetical protein